MGHHNRHFAGDRHALSGAWSPPTSTANFCEEDYEVTRYIAEFINSLTNLAYVYFALYYMYASPSSRGGTRGIFSPKTDIMSVALLVLGICSFLFHATLRHTMQFADEFGMLGLAWSLLQSLLTARPPSSPRSRTWRRIASLALSTGTPAFAAFYVWTGKIIYQATVFGIMIALVVARCSYLLRIARPAYPPAKKAAWTRRGLKTLAMLLVGYGLWHIDLEFCAELRALREEVGLPWAWVLELHGWWHVLTAVAASRIMDVVREMHEEGWAEGKKDRASKT